MRLTVRTFTEPISVECYIYEKAGNKDGYLHGLRKYCKQEFGNEKHNGLEGWGWFMVHPRRIHGSSNEILRQPDDYMRQIVARYPPDNISTPESRQEGLEVLKDFFGDDRFSNYPATNIECSDQTDPDNLEPLDKYFLDEQIKELLIAEMEEEDLNTDFVTNFPDFAAKCWSTDNVSEWARMVLGYGR